MRVDLRAYGPEAADSSQDKSKLSRVSPSARETETAGPDQTRFKFDPARVSSLESQAMTQPDVRQQKVDLLRQSVGKGQYAVSENQIADAVLSDVSGGNSGR